MKIVALKNNTQFQETFKSSRISKKDLREWIKVAKKCTSGEFHNSKSIRQRMNGGTVEVWQVAYENPKVNQLFPDGYSGKAEISD